ncbi:ABC transporter permease [Lentibacillus sp. L22]|uniref:ABC transporter permease n=1 Tax=Lentibacillus TaxID=175304 RepID=UPI0022B165B3|nr:ABC transporter permease [Lentibacillus daqui]
MIFLKHITLFMYHNCKRFGRKWLSLPLLLLFPIIIVSLSETIVISLMTHDKQEPIEIGLVDLDQSDETQLVVGLIEQSTQLGSYLSINQLSEHEANNRLQQNQLSGYITFPKGFTSDLYNGNAVTLPITGNPAKRMDSYIIKELIDSVSRHIRAAQANILTINYFAKQLPIATEQRSDMLFDQFKSFIFYTIGKDKIIEEKTITNHATSSPVHYYGLASWFIIMTIWLIAFYSFLTDHEPLRMNQRMRLYGVTQLQQLMAKMLTSLFIVMILSLLALMVLQRMIHINLDIKDYWRIAIITILYSFTFLEGLATIETVVRSAKLRLLVQSLFTFVILFISGAIIPVLYFPHGVQAYLPYSFANQAYKWLEEIILNQRIYADYLPLALMSASGLFVFVAMSLWKEGKNP